MHTTLGVAADHIPSQVNTSGSSTTYNSHAQRPLLTEILQTFSGHQIIDHTTNPYVKLFSDTHNVHNNNNNNNDFNTGNIISQFPTTFSNSGLAPTCPTSAVSVPQQAMFPPIDGDPHPNAQHYQLSKTHDMNINRYSTRDIDVTTRSLLHQHLEPDTILVNQNEQQRQLDCHDQAAPYHLPRVQTQCQHYSWSSSPVHRCGTNSLFLMQQQQPQAHYHSDDDSIGNLAVPPSQLARPFPLPLSFPVASRQYCGDGLQHSDVYHTTNTGPSLNVNMGNHRGSRSFEESTLLADSVLETSNHPISQLHVHDREGPGTNAGQHHHEQQQQSSLFARQTQRQQVPLCVHNVHRVTTTGAQQKQYKNADIALLQDVRHHMHPRSTLKMQSRIRNVLDVDKPCTNALPDQCSVAGIHINACTNQNGILCRGGSSNVTLNPVVASPPNCAQLYAHILPVDLPTENQLASHSHRLQQNELTGPPGFSAIPVLRKERREEFSGPPGFPMLPTVQQKQQPYEQTERGTNSSDNRIQHSHGRHDLRPYLPSYYQLMACGPSSPLPSVLTPAAVTQQQQQNETCAPHEYHVNQSIHVNLNCAVNVNCPHEPPLAACHPGVFNDWQAVHHQQPISSTVSEYSQMQQHKPAVPAHLNNYAGLCNCPAVPQRSTGVARQYEVLQERQIGQQEALQLFSEHSVLPRLHLSHKVLPVMTTGDAMANIFPNTAAVAAAETAVNLANTVLVCDDDDDDYIDIADKVIEDKDEDDDTIITNASVGAVPLVPPPNATPEPQPEPKTPPTTTACMRSYMHRQDEAKAKENISSPLSSPFITPPRQIIPRARFQSSISRVMSSSQGVEEVEDAALEITLSPHATVHIAQAEREVVQATDDSFQSNVTWTVSSLSQILTCELRNICANGSARLVWHGRQVDTTVRAHGCTNNALVSTNMTDNQQQQQQQRFNCFNSRSKQGCCLDYFIERLVSCANCSASAFIVMLVYVDRVQQRCEYLRLTDLNVHRVVLAALLAAVKFIEDRVCANADYAFLGGVNVQELNQLEFLFNQAADWTFFVTEEEYKAYEHDILHRSTRRNAEGELVILPPVHIDVDRVL